MKIAAVFHKFDLLLLCFPNCDVRFHQRKQLKVCVSESTSPKLKFICDTYKTIVGLHENREHG